MKGLEGFELAPYFERRVMNNPEPRHLLPYIAAVVNEYEEYEVQEDGKLAHWRRVPELSHHIRVITTADGRFSTPSKTRATPAKKRGMSREI